MNILAQVHVPQSWGWDLNPGNVFLNFMHLFIFGCTGSWLLCRAFSSCAEWGLLLQCAGSSLWWLLLSGAQALEGRLSSHGTWAELLHNIWDLPGPRIKPKFPALAGGDQL